MRQLRLGRLAENYGRLTYAEGMGFAECASVCLSDCDHLEKVSLQVEGDHTLTCELHRLDVTASMKASHNDPEVATERGAVGIAFLLLGELEGLTVIERSRKGTGFDWFMGAEGNEDLPFQNLSRLEVSGLLNQKLSRVEERLRQKLKQTDPSDRSGLPAFVAIVEFGRPYAKIVRKPKP